MAGFDQHPHLDSAQSGPLGSLSIAYLGSAESFLRPQHGDRVFPEWNALAAFPPRNPSIHASHDFLHRLHLTNPHASIRTELPILLHMHMPRLHRELHFQPFQPGPCFNAAVRNPPIQIHAPLRSSIVFFRIQPLPIPPPSQRRKRPLLLPQQNLPPTPLP